MAESTAPSNRRVRRFAATISGYTATVATTAAVGLAIIPVIISKSGESGWSAVAVGQSVGSIAAVLTALGWGITGPALIARTKREHRAQIVVNSVVSRLWLSSVVLPVAALVAWFSAPAHPLSSLLAALNVASVGLGLAWYFIGVGSPKRLFLLDTLPRAAGTIVGGCALWLSGSLELFAVIQLLFSGAAVAISTWFATKSSAETLQWKWSAGWFTSQIGQQMLPSATAIATSLYGALPTLAVAWLAPGGVGVFALAERLGRYATMAVSPLHSWMQGWVPAADSLQAMKQRIRTVVITAVLVGITSGLGLHLLGPVLVQVLAGGTITLDAALLVGVAVSVGATTISRCTGSACLIALDDARSVAFSSFVGAATCVLVLALCVPQLGAVGAAVAMAVAEGSVALFQAVALLSLLSRDKSGVRQLEEPTMRRARRSSIG